MMLATRKRLEALEARAPSRRKSGLDREIKEMDVEERNKLRVFLLHAKDGGLPSEKEYDALKRGAERAIMEARVRLGISE